MERKRFGVQTSKPVYDIWKTVASKEGYLSLNSWIITVINKHVVDYYEAVKKRVILRKKEEKTHDNGNTTSE